jgi:hypothetical protein
MTDHRHETHDERELNAIYLELQIISRHVGTLIRGVSELLIQGEKLMAISQETKDALAELDDATNEVAGEIDALVAHRHGQTPAETAEIAAKLKRGGSVRGPPPTQPSGSEPTPPVGQ